MILNAPSFFNSVFAMVKPLLNEATKKKIDLLPVAHAGDEMLKVIPSESLPAHYGGTSEVSPRAFVCRHNIGRTEKKKLKTFFRKKGLFLVASELL